MANALCRLLPNLGGPSAKVRHLYTNTVRSVSLYGAQIWAGDLVANKRAFALVKRADRRMVIKVARCYRTVLYVAATTLARVLPLDLVAKSRAKSYRCAIKVGRSGISPENISRKVAKEKARARKWALREWQHRLSEHNIPGLPGLRTVEAIQPCLLEWVGRRGGGVSFRIAQVFTGHGCFGDYLCRIGKKPTTRCHHYAAGQDSAQHTLELCPAWADERWVLVEVVDEDLSLPSLVRGMLEGEDV
nr:PREDICTED: uncharacterized protein LOC105680171 [Linepithema humile]